MDDIISGVLGFFSFFSQIVALLLENGADVNSRNYCGQVADFLFVLIVFVCPHYYSLNSQL